MCNSAAPGTLARRNTTWKHYINFRTVAKCKDEVINPTQLTICLFLNHLSLKKLTYGTIRSYLFSLVSELRLRGGRDILVPYDSWFIRATLKHYRRKLGNKPIFYRRPMTIDVLNSLIQSLDLANYDQRVYGTMAVIGVFGLLRIGELCYVHINGTKKFIRNKDVSCKKGIASIELFGTKTDLDKKGMTKYFSDIKGNVPNPYRMIFILKCMKNDKETDPFFTLSNGRPVSRVMFVKFMQDKLIKLYPNVDKKEWNGISLRKGGATSAMRAGVQSEIIQKLGGWQTEVYKSYIDHNCIDVVNAQKKMAKVFTMPTT